MNLEVKLQMKMQQKLIMTPNLQLAIKLLQLTKLELKEVLDQNLLENPVLEVIPDNEIEDPSTDSADDKKQDSLFEKNPSATSELAEIYPDKIPETKADEQFKWEEIDEFLREEYDYGYFPKEQKEAVIFENLTRECKSLFDVLYEQLLFSKLDTQQQKLGLLIIGNVDDNGYLNATVDEIATLEAVPAETVEQVLKVIQSFDPPGVAARNLKECMFLQLEQLYPDQEIARLIVENHLDDVERSNFLVICQDLDIPLETVNEAMEIILSLEPKPGRKYSLDEVRYIIPDVIITKVDDEYLVLLNDDGIPRLRISNLYLNILKNRSKSNEGTRDYIEKKLNSAKWLIRSIEQRQQTLYKVSKSILKFQRDFFDKGISYLKPLVLRDVAEDIEMHESTVSRVSTNKYMHTPRGVFELKYFFHSGLSSTYGEDISSLRIKELIKNMIHQENQQKPLSDKKIANMLYQQGIKIARRTVAKYREELKILPSNRRKKVMTR
ncbi:RNA polymerase factor sigma-54 [candidate division CSSED10-310 bacterium]|uniref:RNA polymerase factor sigma-54 n=1 Tax=candidate division CSSED10-310 bacterium TaxID=2855610 RepID=A0ABV6Z2V9_UNCC1